jgi:hypothetical protein
MYVYIYVNVDECISLELYMDGSSCFDILVECRIEVINVYVYVYPFIWINIYVSKFFEWDLNAFICIHVYSGHYIHIYVSIYINLFIYDIMYI